MTSRAEWHQPTSTAEAHARANGRAAYNAARKRAADAQARAIVTRLVQLGPVRGAQAQVAREHGVSKATVSRSLLRCSASLLRPSDAVSPILDDVIETMPRGNMGTAEASEVRTDPARTGQFVTLRQAVRAALGIEVQPAPPRRLTKAQKAERRAQLAAEVFARWLADTRTEAEWMADAGIVIPTPAEQHAEGLDMLAAQRRSDEQWAADQRWREQRRHELDLDARALLADVRSDP